MEKTADSRSSRSPWNGSSLGRSVAFAPLGPEHRYDSEIRVPGSKSYSNRALIIAALATGTSRLRGVLRSDDTYWMIDALRRLGVSISVEEDVISIIGSAGNWPAKRGELFVGSAGTGARFIPGALAVDRDGEWVVDGSDQLRRRPVKPLLDALRSLGGRTESLSGDGSLPIRVCGGGLDGGEVTISGSVSSQFISGLLIASPYARGAVTIRLTGDLVQPDYIRMTIDVMRAFGVEVEHSDDVRRIRVSPQVYEGRNFTVEADASTACYFLSLPALNGGRVRVTNVAAATRQPDARFVDVLERMGVTVVRGQGFLETRSPSKLRGNLTVDMRPMSDQALTLAALAPFADGPVTVKNVAHIRKHESDRIKVVCEALDKLGVRAEEHADGFTVYPGSPKAAALDPHDDHRSAMAFSLIGTRVPGLRILDPGCVSKTCPEFFDLLKRTGVRFAS